MSNERFPQLGQYATGFCRLSMRQLAVGQLWSVRAFGSFRRVHQLVIVDLFPLDQEGGSSRSVGIRSKFSLQS